MIHNPRCPVEEYGLPYLCLCELIFNVRADERESMRRGSLGTQLREAVAVRDNVLLNLRAKMEALETFHNMVWKQDVLALLDAAEWTERQPPNSAGAPSEKPGGIR